MYSLSVLLVIIGLVFFVRRQLRRSRKKVYSHNSPVSSRDLFGNKLKVLISDDDVDVTNAIRFILEEQGYECAAAYSAEETISKIKTFRPHLLLTDIMKPKIDGFEMIRIIKEKVDAKLPIIICSAAVEEESRKDHGFTLGVDDIIDEPFEPQELLNRIQGVMDKRIRGVSQ